MKRSKRLERIEAAVGSVPNEELIWSAAGKILAPFGQSDVDEDEQDEGQIPPPAPCEPLTAAEQRAMKAARIDGLAMLFSWIDAHSPPEGDDAGRGSL